MIMLAPGPLRNFRFIDSLERNPVFGGQHLQIMERLLIVVPGQFHDLQVAIRFEASLDRADGSTLGHNSDEVGRKVASQLQSRPHDVPKFNDKFGQFHNSLQRGFDLLLVVGVFSIFNEQKKSGAHAPLSGFLV
mgnify:CR=1 FL=1